MSDVLIYGGFAVVIACVIFFYASGTAKQAKENKELLRDMERLQSVNFAVVPATQKLVFVLVLIIGLLGIFSFIYFTFFWTL